METGAGRQTCQRVRGEAQSTQSTVTQKVLLDVWCTEQLLNNLSLWWRLFLCFPLTLDSVPPAPHPRLPACPGRFYSLQDPNLHGTNAQLRQVQVPWAVSTWPLYLSESSKRKKDGRFGTCLRGLLGLQQAYAHQKEVDEGKRRGGGGIGAVGLGCTSSDSRDGGLNWLAVDPHHQTSITRFERRRVYLAYDTGVLAVPALGKYGWRYLHRHHHNCTYDRVTRARPSGTTAFASSTKAARS